MGDEIFTEIRDSIAPACSDSAGQARRVLSGLDQTLSDNVEKLAIRLAGARHSARPDVSHKHVVVCAADHGQGSHWTGPTGAGATATAVRMVVSGHAAVNTAARAAGASVVVVDCGMADDRAAHAGVVDLRIGNGTGDICRGPAMTRDAARVCIDTGIALMFSLASDAATDCLALGQLAPGSQAVSEAVIAAMTGMEPDEFAPAQARVVTAALAANRGVVGNRDRGGEWVIDVLAALGGHEIGVMAGMILAAGAIRVPVVLDECATSAAALLASGLAPRISGYLIAAHVGESAGHRRALAELGLSALFDLGLAHGEGTGAALALPLIDSAARLLRTESV
ncbi:MAG: nicotinate-nucleotide--dimethylbenzimidazole phosphoribosyltransferase [Proteobacteria bacterium]|nr:nicotinate-nucleotide--dimethylbenzimidazole phosphoribosyltransferase [Pseudomonadota bacterium]